MARRRGSAPRPFSRTDRVGELVREIVASELERIGDERLELVTIMAADVDASLEHAEVFYSCLAADEEGRSDEVAEALEDQRWKIQQVVNREVRARRTPQIRFSPDTVLSSALRIDEILQSLNSPGGDDGAPEGGRADDTRAGGMAADDTAGDDTAGDAGAGGSGDRSG